jgi:membrane fusion protein (multidrug efflux system)
MTTVRQRFSAMAMALAFASLFGQIACNAPSSTDATSQVSEAPPAIETRLRVKVAEVQRAKLSDGGSVTGTVRAFHRARITAETQGRVVRRTVEPGAVLDAGEVMIELESSRLELEVRRTQAALQASRTVLAHAKREFERGERLSAENAISAQRRDDLALAVDRARDDVALAVVARDTAKRDLADARIVAPFAGTVDSIEVSVGDFVSSGTPVATMVDLSRVRIFGGVTAREAARLKAGAAARVSFSDLGGRSFDATLQSVGRVADEGDGTFEIELWLENVEALMRDGLVAHIELPNADSKEFVLAPREALLRRDGHPEIFVVTEESGRAVVHARRLRTGRSDGQWIEIVDGLESGELIVYDGQFALSDGATVEIDRVAVADGPE